MKKRGIYRGKLGFIIRGRRENFLKKIRAKMDNHFDSKYLKFHKDRATNLCTKNRPNPQESGLGCNMNNFDAFFILDSHVATSRARKHDFAKAKHCTDAVQDRGEIQWHPSH